MTTTTYSEEQTAALVTQFVASLIRDAQKLGASPDKIADLWALRALPLAQQMRRLPEWRQCAPSGGWPLSLPEWQEWKEWKEWKE